MLLPVATVRSTGPSFIATPAPWRVSTTASRGVVVMKQISAEPGVVSLPCFELPSRVVKVDLRAPQLKRLSISCVHTHLRAESGSSRSRKFDDFLKHRSFNSEDGASVSHIFIRAGSWKLDVGADQQVDQVQQGEADWMFAFDTVPPDRLDETNTRYTDQRHYYVRPVTYFMSLNERAPVRRSEGPAGPKLRHRSRRDSGPLRR
jgi:hypothetical protein